MKEDVNVNSYRNNIRRSCNEEFYVTNPKCKGVFAANIKRCVNYSYCKQKGMLKAIGQCSVLFDPNLSICISCDRFNLCKSVNELKKDCF